MGWDAGLEGGAALLGAHMCAPHAVACAPLHGPGRVETWFAGAIGESAETIGAAWAHGRHYALCAVSVAEEDGDIENAAATAYERLLTCVRPSERPYLLRIWNYFAAINEGEGDDERYRRFCVGRARAVDGMFNDPPPAATAIGTDGRPDRVQLIAIDRQPGEIDGQNRARCRCDGRFDPIQVDVARGGINIDEDRPRADFEDHVARGHP